jgi:hypothetical protein
MAYRTLTAQQQPLLFAALMPTPAFSSLRLTPLLSQKAALRLPASPTQALGHLDHPARPRVLRGKRLSLLVLARLQLGALQLLPLLPLQPQTWLAVVRVKFLTTQVPVLPLSSLPVLLGKFCKVTEHPHRLGPRQRLAASAT